MLSRKGKMNHHCQQQVVSLTTTEVSHRGQGFKNKLMSIMLVLHPPLYGGMPSQFIRPQQQLEMASDNSRLAGPSEFQPAASKPPPKKVLNSQTKTKTGIKTKVKVVADLIILKLVYTTSNSSQPLKLANYTECHSTTP